ncbi:MAG: hypothetical protein LQ345_002586 [Seirophora villosa]|nr:MAG: hypothetical protein LQ345_002586 [Seirophora villosa]
MLLASRTVIIAASVQFLLASEMSQNLQPGNLDDEAKTSAASSLSSIPSPTTDISQVPPFPLTPHLWYSGTAFSVCAFVNYTRLLLYLLFREPDSLSNRRFELEAFILLLHCGYKWFRYAQQLMGSILTTRNPQELRDEERNDYTVRLQCGCRDLIDPGAYQGVGEREKQANEAMREKVKELLVLYLGEGKGVWKTEFRKEDLDKCEEWAQKMCNLQQGGEPEGLPNEDGK